MHSLGLLHERRLHVALALYALLLGHALVAIYLAHRACEIGNHEHLRILRVHLVAAEIGERDLARALIDCEVELLAESNSLFLAHF